MSNSISIQEYTYLSDYVYNVGRNENNLLSLDGIGSEWEIVEYREQGYVDKDFSAGAFQKGNDIVIVFTGTNNGVEFFDANIPAGIGFPVDQIKDAIDFTIQILRDNPDANITLSGHSLGGGLASVVSTFFNIPATIFDAAPFENSVAHPAMVFYYANYVKERWGTELPAEFEAYCNSSAIGDAWQDLEYGITDDMVYGVMLAKTYLDYNKGQVGQEYGVGASLLKHVLSKFIMEQLANNNIDIPNIVITKEMLLELTGATEFDKLCKEAGKFNGFAQRESQITNYFVGGEALEALRDVVPVIGKDSLLDIGRQVTLNGVDSLVDIFHDYNIPSDKIIYWFVGGQLLKTLKELIVTYVGTGALSLNDIMESAGLAANMHLQPLTQAVIWSEDFREALKKHKYGVATFFDNNLYGYDYNKLPVGKGEYKEPEESNTHFLVEAVKNHTTNKNGWLDKIAADMNKIIDSDAEVDDGLVKGLLAALTEYWYYNKDVNKTAINELQGGVQVDFTKYSNEADNNGRLRLISSLFSEVAKNSNFFKNSQFGWNPDLERQYNIFRPLKLKNAELINIGNYNQNFSINSADNNSNTIVWGYNSASTTATTGAGDDTLIGSYTGKNNLSGGAGDDVIISHSDALNLLDGGLGNDSIYAFGNGKAEIKGGEGNDIIYAYGDNSEIDGGTGNDTIYSYGNNTKTYGGDNNDTIYSYGDNAQIDGGEGNDYIVVQGKGSVVTGGKGNDTLIGGDGVDVLDGGEGIDEYHVGDGDVIFDSDGQGKIFFNGKLLSHAVLVEGENNSYTDFEGNTYTFEGTTLVVNGTLSIDGFLEPGITPDSLGYSYTKMGITIFSPNQSDSPADENQYEKIEATDKEGEYIQGQDATKNYDLIGAEGDDTLVGNDGNDFLQGGKGDDLLQGSKGNDTLIGGEGSNCLFGGEGNDKLYAEEQTVLDPQWGNTGSSGSQGKGSLLSGGEGEDTIVGSTKDDIIFAGEGSNLIFAGEGDDVIYLNYEATSVNKNWSVEKKYDGEIYYYDLKGINYKDIKDKDAVNIVYAGAGNDYIVGGIGNDFRWW